jgi:hypothetical protein
MLCSCNIEEREHEVGAGVNQTIRFCTVRPRKSPFSIKIDFSEQIDFGLQLCDDRAEQEQDQIDIGHT